MSETGYFQFLNKNIILLTGKGSTCAFTESILRQYGLKTGFFSSPHLVSVTERIRINGQPLSQEKFAQHFWQVYDKLEDKPAYFKFLTVMAFNVFIEEKVDVAVIEVGIGGAFDSTNVIERPICVGITLLDFDHVKVLGNTIEEIAWHKAGIMKPGTVAFANPNQPESALITLQERAKEIGCQIFTAPDLDYYNWSEFPRNELGLFKVLNWNILEILELNALHYFCKDSKIHSIKLRTISAVFKNKLCLVRFLFKLFFLFMRAHFFLLFAGSTCRQCFIGATAS